MPPSFGPPALHAGIVARHHDRDKAYRFRRCNWRVDTGIERFALAQILPGADRTAFVGTKPRQPDKVPQPLLVLVDHTSGRLVTHSLGR